MMKNKIIIGTIIIGIFIVSSNRVFAVSAAPSPTCKINAEITKVNYVEAYFQEDDGRPCNAGGRNIPAKYLLKVKINEISTIKEEGDFACQELYPVNSEKTLTIFESQINSGDSFKENQILEGNIHFSGDECSSGIYLSDYKILEDGTRNITINVAADQRTNIPETDLMLKVYSILSYGGYIHSKLNDVVGHPILIKDNNLLGLDESVEIIDSGSVLRIGPPIHCETHNQRISDVYFSIVESCTFEITMGKRIPLPISLNRFNGQMSFKLELPIYYRSLNGLRTSDLKILKKGEQFVMIRITNHESLDWYPEYSAYFPFWLDLDVITNFGFRNIRITDLLNNTQTVIIGPEKIEIEVLPLLSKEDNLVINIFVKPLNGRISERPTILNYGPTTPLTKTTEIRPTETKPVEAQIETITGEEPTGEELKEIVEILPSKIIEKSIISKEGEIRQLQSECQSYVDDQGCVITECTTGESSKECPSIGKCSTYIDDEGCTIVECTSGEGSKVCPITGECSSYVDDWGCTVTECTTGESSRECPIIEPVQIERNVETSKGLEEVSIQVHKNEIFLTSEQVTTKTSKKLVIKENKLSIETTEGEKEVKVLPNTASEKATEIGMQIINEIELKEESQKPIYSLKGTKQARILFIIPITLRIEIKVSAETGDVISVKKPWWSFLAW